MKETTTCICRLFVCATFVAFYGNLAIAAENEPAGLLPAAARPTKTADVWLDENASRIRSVADSIWGFAELAFQEHQSSKLLADTLAEAGFNVRRGVAGMDTAFVAEYGAGKPVIAFLAEFDALPELSQKVVPFREPLEPGRPGHGCGHNLLGTASVAAGMAVKEAMVTHGLPGKVVVLGTPAEEGGAGKVYMVRAGLFRDVDAVIAWHPDEKNYVNAGSSLAIKRARFRFFGLSAHAALAPEQGRSALDAVELMNVASNYLREHISTQTRIHYVITDGGARPNVVPEEAEVWYYVRTPSMSEAHEAFARLAEIAQGACLMTRTRVEIRDETGSHELLPNMGLADLVHRHLQRVGGPAFDDVDFRFAASLQGNAGATVPLAGPPVLNGEISPISLTRRMSSTDVGDVSWVVPTIEFRVTARVVGTAAHSWPFTATAGHPIGHKACLTAARVMAGAALELFVEPDRLQSIREEFLQRTAGFTYQCPIPADRPPPLKIDP